MDSLASFVYFFMFNAVLITFSHSHRNCEHRPPGTKEVVHNVVLDQLHVIIKRSINQPLRVFKYYDDSVEKLSTEKRDLIHNTVIPQAVSYWEKTLMLRYSNASIRLNRRCDTDQVFFRLNDPYPYCQNACDDKTMCGEVKVPDDHLDVCRVCASTGHNCGTRGSAAGKGITNADFVFYISALQTDRCHKGTVVAYAAHCQQEAALDRPIAGHANLCPDSISTKPQELETLISTVKHEMLHALGFSVSLYAFYRDKAGNPLTPRGQNGKPVISKSQDLHEWSTNVSKSFVRKNWKVSGGPVSRTVQMIVTPRVVEEARKHFDCPTLEGAELEDQGGEGTALTHWEKRVFENEAMTGTHTQNPSYSRVTLALMEDTGWYMPNYDMAEELSWGHNLGCEFATKSCKDWMDVKNSRNENIHPFCDKVKKDPPQTECNARRTSVALCNLVQYTTPLPPIFQNFDTISNITANFDTYGGSVDLADYCPYLQEFTWKQQNVVVRGSQCQYEENNPKLSQNFALEKYGKNSKCFDHGPKMWEERNCGSARVWQHWGSGCYEYSCKAGRLIVNILNHTYTCYYNKQVLQIQLLSNDWLHMGSINCPSCEEMCGGSGMKCLAEDKTSPSTSNYYQDNLVCGGHIVKLSPFNLWDEDDEDGDDKSGDDDNGEVPPTTTTKLPTTTTKRPTTTTKRPITTTKLLTTTTKLPTTITKLLTTTPKPYTTTTTTKSPMSVHLPIMPAPPQAAPQTQTTNAAPAIFSTQISQLTKIYQVIYLLKKLGAF